MKASDSRKLSNFCYDIHAISPSKYKDPFDPNLKEVMDCINAACLKGCCSTSISDARGTTNYLIDLGYEVSVHNDWYFISW